MNIVQRIRRRIMPPPGEMLTAAHERAIRATPPFTRGEVLLWGKPLAFSDRDGLTHSIDEIFHGQVYRFDAKTKAPHIIDAGANIGLSVRYFKRCYPQATIIAYEPDAKIFPMLRHNVGDMPGVELRQAAAWTENGTLTFYSEGSLAGSSEMDFLAKGEAIHVRAERLRDEIVKRPVDFLKIDIEGAENSVMFDIADVLDQVDHLFFEYHSVPGKDQQLGDLLNLVREAGFRYVINGTHGPPLPFVQTFPHGFDLQLNVFCIRRDAAEAKAA